jgi:hypothetical protein
LVCAGSFGISRGTARPFGTRAKYWSTIFEACAMSKSPTIVTVAFSGT